jgi:hypothetical protein
MPADAIATPVAPVAAAPLNAASAEPIGASDAIWKARIEESRNTRKEFKETWKENVQRRKGKPYKEAGTTDRAVVPADWSFTKAKEAQMFSQVPTVILTAEHELYKAAVPVFQKELNHVLTKLVKVGVVMEESLPDAINKSGIAGCKVGYMATFEPTQIPAVDVSQFPPEIQRQMMQSGQVQMLDTMKRVDCKFYATRISPDQLLWPKEFKGSDFDEAAWVGWDGSYTWAQALREFAQSEARPRGLRPDQKETICGGADRERTETDEDTPSDDSHLRVTFTEIFYNAAKDDPNEKHFDKIRRKVYVDGIDEPVVDEDFNGQEWNEETESFVGLTKYPIRFLTLTYISDEAIPPSDSEVGRPMVDEQQRSRTQMMLQRDRATPMRWANSNRVDPMVLQNIMRGGYQAIIPVNGDGSNALGEVARAAYPHENWDFDKTIRGDLMEAWQVGPNQAGGFNMTGRTASEAGIVQENFQTRVAKERAKVSNYFLGIAECVAGYMQLFYDGPKENALLSPEELKRIQVWDRTKVNGAKFVFSIREDATVKRDSAQRIQQIERFLNLTAKSGFVNVEPVIAELAALSGLDPAEVIVPPKGEKPETPNISLRVGLDELIDPIIGPYMVSLLQKGYPVTEADMMKARAILLTSSGHAQPPPEALNQGPQQQPGPGAPQPPEDYGPAPRVTKRPSEFGG